MSIESSSPPSHAPAAEAAAVPEPGFLATLKEALAGSQQDFTEGSIGRAVFLLAVPMVLEMMMESLFAICDVFWVSRLGSEAVATVGLTESVMTLLMAVAIGLAMGTTAMVARRIGEKKPEAAAAVGVQSILLGIAVSAVVAVPGVIFAPRILELMGASPGLIAVGSGYTAVMMGGSVTLVLLFLINAVFRGAGDAAIAMRVLWLANAINIVLDPCLIFGWGPFPELGVAGAAVATTIGRGIGVLFQLWVLFRGASEHLPVSVSHVRPHLELIGRLIKVSTGGVLQFLVATCSWVAVVRVIALFGDTAVAGYTIAIRIVIFTILPAWGMSNAAATLMGQNLGAGKPDRAEKSVWRTGHYNAVFMVVVSVLFYVIPSTLVGVFTSDPEVLRVGVQCLRTVAVGYVFYAYGMVLVQAFNGAGDTMTPTWINLFCYWMFQIPLAYFLATQAGLESQGVFFAILAAEMMLSVTAMVIFRRGGWRTKEV